MWLPPNDPFVIFGIALLLSSIVLAIVLLTCVSYKSAEEVWETVEQKTDWKRQKFPVEEKKKDGDVDDRDKVTPAELENGVKNESPVKRVVSKLVRFSSRIQRHAPVPQNDDDDIVAGHAQGRNFGSGDIADAGRRSMSWNQQQTNELHFF